MEEGPPQAVLQGQPANHCRVLELQRTGAERVQKRSRKRDQVSVREMNESESIEDVSKRLIVIETGG